MRPAALGIALRALSLAALVGVGGLSQAATLSKARLASARVGASLVAITHRPGHPADAAPPAANDLRPSQVAAVESYLRHAYTIYLGLKACSELRTEQNDPSFLSTVGLEEARHALRAVDSAASAVGIDVNAQWALAAPKATVTAEALKQDPQRFVAVCQRMGGIFRNDEANLQNLLGALGSKQLVIPKDF